MTRRPPVVLSLGGSVLAPDGIDRAYLRRFVAFVRTLARTRRIVIVVGGGQTSRRAIDAVRASGKVSHADLDWIGIAGTRLNAEVVRASLGTLAHPQVLADPDTPFRLSASSSRSRGRTPQVLVAAGWKPGFSTDADAVLWAVRFGARLVANLSNVAYVYDGDPRRTRRATPFSELTWTVYRRMFGTAWGPGAHAPFDPIASRMAAQHRLEVVVLHGRDLVNLRRCLNGERFVGTRLHS
ncbi:MAG: UMP kinase [Candidatus Kerfeldbacteria bacterium]|nr:UMP kinase [Candidatus Kerfeldbacteria bacterium]